MVSGEVWRLLVGSDEFLVLVRSGGFWWVLVCTGGF
jgi:hypothetical protein